MGIIERFWSERVGGSEARSMTLSFITIVVVETKQCKIKMQCKMQVP